MNLWRIVDQFPGEDLRRIDLMIRRYPDRYSWIQLPTLQRRVRQWRGVMAYKPVYASAEQSELDEELMGNIGPQGVNWKWLNVRQHLPVRQRGPARVVDVAHRHTGCGRRPCIP